MDMSKKVTDLERIILEERRLSTDRLKSLENTILERTNELSLINTRERESKLYQEQLNVTLENTKELLKESNELRDAYSAGQQLAERDVLALETEVECCRNFLRSLNNYVQSDDKDQSSLIRDLRGIGPTRGTMVLLLNSVEELKTAETELCNELYASTNALSELKRSQVGVASGQVAAQAKEELGASWWLIGLLALATAVWELMK